MTQNFLDGNKVNTFLHKQTGEGMPQKMIMKLDSRNLLDPPGRVMKKGSVVPVLHVKDELLSSGLL